MTSENGTISLADEVYEKALREVIESKFNKSADEFDTICSLGSSKGDGYAGLIYRIKVIEKETNEVKLSIILKTPPKSEARREMFTSEIFDREAEFYGTLYPMYQKFQEEKGIDIIKDGFYHAPLCYKITTENQHEGLFLEDLRVLNYDLHDRSQTVSKEHVFLVYRTLAKMHAIFYALQDQRPELVKPYIKMPEIFMLILQKEGNPMSPWFEGLKGQTLEVVRKTGNKYIIGKITKLLEGSFYDILKEIFDHDKIGTYATLCHGDCWTNNMMFQFNENKVPEEIRFLDFQVLRHASPVCDLVYYLFTCTDKELRDKHYQDFLDAYYSELSTMIKRLGSDPEKLYPRHIFESHLKQFAHFGFIMSMMCLPIFTNDIDDSNFDVEKLAENMKKMEETGEMDAETFDFIKPKNQDKFTERMLGVINDMYRLGYI